MNNTLVSCTESESEPFTFDRIKYYKPQFFGHKWKDCYAILWSTSDFKWYSKKTNKSWGFINIEKAVPCIYTGVQTCKIPARQPLLPPGYFTRNLVAISLDKKAKHVLWFLFETIVDLNIWVSAVKKTIPRLNPSFYNVELGSVTGHSYTLSRSSSEKKKRLKRSYSNGSDCYILTPSITNYGQPYSETPFFDYCSNTLAEIIFIGGEGYSAAGCETSGFFPDFSGGDYSSCGIAC